MTETTQATATKDHRDLVIRMLAHELAELRDRVVDLEDNCRIYRVLVQGSLAGWHLEILDRRRYQRTARTLAGLARGESERVYDDDEGDVREHLAAGVQ